MSIIVKDTSENIAASSQDQELANLIATLDARIERLEAAKDSTDLIFAWDYGLGVKFSDDGKKVSAVCLTDATAVERNNKREVSNGMRQRAQIVVRGPACAVSAEKVRNSRDFLIAAAAKAPQVGG